MQEVVQWKKAESGEEHGDSIHSGVIKKLKNGGSCSRHSRRATHDKRMRVGSLCRRVVFVV